MEQLVLMLFFSPCDTHGYASEGESFSIADASGEVWIMEVIGRGPTYGKKGAVWVARRVPGTYSVCVCVCPISQESARIILTKCCLDVAPTQMVMSRLMPIKRE
jgi:Peptidase family C69